MIANFLNFLNIRWNICIALRLNILIEGRAISTALLRLLVRALIWGVRHLSRRFFLIFLVLRWFIQFSLEIKVGWADVLILEVVFLEYVWLWWIYLMISILIIIMTFAPLIDHKRGVEALVYHLVVSELTMLRWIHLIVITSNLHIHSILVGNTEGS